MNPNDASPEAVLRQALDEVNRRTDEITELLQALIRCDTTNTGVEPSGRESIACQVLHQYLDGVACETLESAPGRGNFIARLEGVKDPNKSSLLLMGHLDVAPAGDLTDWKHPPFSGAIDNGRVYGRGAIDCKAMVAAEAAALKILHDLGAPFRGRITMVSGADEETGGSMGFGWLAANHPDVLRADLGVNEGGGRPCKNHNGTQAYLISPGEKGRYEINFIVRGHASHASVPWSADNPLITAAQLIERIAKLNPEPTLNCCMLALLPELFGISVPVTADELEETLQLLNDINPSLSRGVRAATRMTLAPTMIQAGDKSNSIPGICRLICDARTCPGQNEDDLRALISEAIGGLHGIEAHVTRTAEPSGCNWTPEIAQRFERALSHAMDGTVVRAYPTLCTGFTDSRFARALGTPMYGFQPKHPDTNRALNDIHCANESCSIQDLIFLTRALIAFLLDHQNMD
ncbi:M20/M25/M40 family metallo-hydrolase [Candidatus Sumerlaeota bacterium]|nr:M20/M25/M40 family metallo-hydrolase [Candidatus Sumerlaeota bacterium]